MMFAKTAIGRAMKTPPWHRLLKPGPTITRRQGGPNRDPERRSQLSAANLHAPRRQAPCGDRTVARSMLIVMRLAGDRRDALRDRAGRRIERELALAEHGGHHHAVAQARSRRTAGHGIDVDRRRRPSHQRHDAAPRAEAVGSPGHQMAHDQLTEGVRVGACKDGPIAVRDERDGKGGRQIGRETRCIDIGLELEPVVALLQLVAEIHEPAQRDDASCQRDREPKLRRLEQQ